MVAIRSFMDTDAKGQVGGIECNEQARKKIAGESAGWKCANCGKSNSEIMREREEAVKELGGEKSEEVVPEELRLAYRDELGKGTGGSGSETPTTKTSQNEPKGKEKALENGPISVPSPQNPAPIASGHRGTAQPPPTRTIQLPQAATQHSAETSPAWIDHAIYGIIAALVFMILRKFV
jgi:ubiquitin-conjugating enzyme E2 J1